MYARFPVIFCACLMATPCMADERFIGLWRGKAAEQGSTAKYDITITVYETAGRVYQYTKYGPPAECDAGGILLEARNGVLRFSDMIIRNRQDCADGFIRLYLNGTDGLIWEVFDTQGAYVAGAALTKGDR